MKKIALVCLIVAVAAVSFAFVTAEKRAAEVIILRGVIVVTGPKGSSSIKVYKHGSPTQTTELDKISSKESFDEAMVTVTETLNTYVNNGYEIVSSNEFGGNATVILTYTLKK